MWWFKRAVLQQTDSDVQLMHPWFINFSQLEPGIRDLVWALNQTDLVDTLSSCEGHPESPEWWEATGTAYVLYRVTHPTRWSRVLSRLQELSQIWKGVDLVVEGQREQWLGFRAHPGQPDAVRRHLDQTIGQATALVKEYLDQEVVNMTALHQSLQRPRRWNIPG